MLALDHLVFVKYRVRSSEIDYEIASRVSLHDSGDNVLLLAVIIVIENSALLLAYLLKNNVLSVLYRYPSKLDGMNVYVYCISCFIL